ncbi:MAG: hypothetical protein HFG93_09755 [Dorea sp.]|nr:hypothetical protein [Dorea sp.]
MNEIFYENIPQAGLLLLEQILFSFEGIPMVFVCIDKECNRYLCICDDVINEEAWLIVKIDDNRLLRILNDEDTVLSAFRDQKVIIVNRGAGGEFKYNFVDYCEIDPDELPLCDQYLEMKEYLTEYIDKLKRQFLIYNFTFDLEYNMCYNGYLDLSEKHYLEGIANKSILYAA